MRSTALSPRPQSPSTPTQSRLQSRSTPMILNELPYDCIRGIVGELSITDSSKFRQTSKGNLNTVKETKVDQLGKFFKNAKCAESYTIKTIEAYMLEGGSTLEGHTGRVSSVIQLENGKLVSASYDGTLKVWDLSKPEGQQCVANLRGHTNFS